MASRAELSDAMSSGVGDVRRPPTRLGEAFAARADRLDLAKLCWAALAVALLVAAGLILYLLRGTTLFFDEWLWAQSRRGSSVSTFLDSYNGHLSLVPILIYRVLFAVGGLHDYLPYKLTAIAGHLACVLLLYVYLNRRVGPPLALMAAILILFFGPGWQEILWPFQIAWLVAIGTGVGALLMLDRRDRRGDVLACLLIAISLASTSIGVAVALGIAVEIALARRRWRDAWIVAIPLALYVVWALAYQSRTFEGSVFGAASFMYESAAVALSALFGLSGVTPLDVTGTLVTYGAPLAVAAGALLIWVTYRRGGWPARAVALATVLVVFWGLTALGRSGFGGPETSRYLYASCFFVLLLAGELAAGVRVAWPAIAALAVVTVAATLSNLGVLRAEAGFVRLIDARTKAVLAALDLDRNLVAPGFVATVFPGYPYVPLNATKYFAAERTLGTPAYSLTQLASASPDARATADSQMMLIRRMALQPASSGPTAGPPPLVGISLGGSVTKSPSCVAFRPSAVPPGVPSEIQVTLPRAGVWLSSSRAPATIGVRRFGDTFRQLGTLAAGAAATLRIAPDAAPQQWHMQVVADGPVRVCGL
jgi:hypothetical protein